MSPIKQIVTKMAASVISKKLNRPFTVIVEGNIGSGKTSFLEHFDKHDYISIVPEPIDDWRNCRGYNLLGLMYEDPRKWSFTFQSYVQLTMLQKHEKVTQNPIKMMERSIYSARYCFVEKHGRDGLLEKPAVAVLDDWFKWLLKNANVNVDLIVYLRTSPEVVYERILKRSRAEEKTVSFEYIKALHDIHEDWLYHKTIHSCPAPVLVLNANLDKSVIEGEYERCENEIFNVIPLKTPAVN